MSQGLNVSCLWQNIPRSLWPENNFCHLVNPPESLTSQCPKTPLSTILENTMHPLINCDECKIACLVSSTAKVFRVTSDLFEAHNLSNLIVWWFLENYCISKKKTHKGDTESLNVCGQQHQYKNKQTWTERKIKKCHVSCLTCQVSRVASNLSPVTNANSHSHRPSPC